MILEEGVLRKRKVVFKFFDYFLQSLNTLGVICFFVGIWHLASLYLADFILPKPLEVFKRSLELLSDKDSEILITLYRAFLAIILAFVLGVFLGMISVKFKAMLSFFKPLMDILLGIAPIVWIVLALVWFSFGDLSVIFTTFMAILPLSFASSMMSVLSLDEKMKDVCVVYKLSLFKRLKFFYLPHILPFLLTSLSIVVAMGIKIIVMAELLGASDGVGAKIAQARNFLDTTQVLAYVVLMIALILLFEACIIKSLKILFLPSKYD